MIGGNIRHYRIVEEVGRGGRGIVYRAEDTRLGRTVAIKCLLHHVKSNSDERKRFEQEARVASCLNHPGIATIYGLEEIDEQMFIVMEYIEGQDLRKLLGNGLEEQSAPALPLEMILQYAVQIAEALQAAHKKGIVHRDIKPENILVTNYGQVKITDFGLAKIAGSELLTKTGEIMGTVAYMSPEQLNNQSLDLRTDIWSWGVMLYEMVYGERPFTGQYEQALIYSILNERPGPFNSRYSGVSPKLEYIITKALSRDPADRYQNCEQLLSDLQSCVPAVSQTNSNPPGEVIPVRNSSIKSTKELTQAKSGLPHGFYKLIYTHWKIAAVIFILAVACTYIFFLAPPAAVAGSRKIAVLPFVNINNDPADEYFSDGIMEDILTQLVKIGDLKVISRTTMMTYRESPKTLREISKELQADVVLEGSVRKDANQIRIAVQLIDANTDAHLWAEIYDRHVDQMFIVQSEIAQNVANALHARLSPDERDRLRAPVVPNPEGYDLLLKGGYNLSLGSREDVGRAIDLFEQAIGMDAKNARAWAQLATAYARQADLGAMSAEEGYSKARKAAEKALALDDQLAQGHTIMGWIKRSYDWDWEGAEIECRKALEIAPGDVNVIRNMANLEKSLGRFDQAIELMKRASELDPWKVPIYTSLGLLSMHANRLEEAAMAYRKAIELNSAYPVSHTFLGLVFLLQGKPHEAIVEIQKESDEGWRLYGLAQAHYGARHKAEADMTLKALIEKYGGDSAYQVAEVYAYRGEADAAFEWLEKAYVSRDGGLSEIKGDPFMKKIENDRRYVEFMKKMRLPI